jgi:predicted aspartyl protease
MFLSISLVASLGTGCGLTANKDVRNNRQQSDFAMHRVSGPERISIPLKLIRGLHPVIEAKLGNRRLNLLVDTGTTWTHLPASLFDPSPDGWTRVARLCLGDGFCFEDFPARVAENNYVSDRPDTFNGVLGVHLLRRHMITFDYASGVFHVGRNPTDEALSVPFQWDAATARPFAEVSVGDSKPGILLLDTGASYTRLTPQLAAASGISTERGVDDRSVTFNSIDPVRNIRIGNFCVGKICQSDMPVSIARWPAIGGTFLRNYSVTFDFPNRKLYLVAAPNIDAADKVYRRLGIRLHPQNSGLVVGVRLDSPAYEAGITAGDRIVRIGESDAGNMGYFAFLQRLSGYDGRSIPITIKTNVSTLADIVLTSAEGHQ